MSEEIEMGFIYECFFNGVLFFAKELRFNSSHSMKRVIWLHKCDFDNYLVELMKEKAADPHTRIVPLSHLLIKLNGDVMFQGRVSNFMHPVSASLKGKEVSLQFYEELTNQNNKESE